MPRLPIAILPLLLIDLPAQTPETAPAEITWHSDLAAARKLAAERKAPLWITFRCER